MSLRHASSKLQDALSCLVLGPEEIRVRLVDAYFKLIAVTPSSLPEKVVEDFRWVIEQIEAGGPLMTEGRRKSKLTHIRKKAGVKIAQRLYYIIDFVHAYEDDLHPSTD